MFYRQIDFEVSDWGELGSPPRTVPGYRERVMSLNPLAYWRFESQELLLQDDIGLSTLNGVGGVAADPEGALEGGVGGCVRMDGGGSQLNAGQAILPAGSGAISLCLWMRATVATTSALVSQYVAPGTAGYEHRFGLRLVSGGGIGWWRAGVVKVQSSASLLDGKWHMVAAERQSTGVLRLWVDGVLVDEGSDSQPFVETETVLGAFPGVSSYEGWLDEVAVCPEALGETAIKSLWCWGCGLPQLSGGAA